jgi:hypothetical protein
MPVVCVFPFPLGEEGEEVRGWKREEGSRGEVKWK